MFLVKLFTSVLAAFLITFGYFDVWGEKLNKNAAPLKAMFISLWVVLTIAICVLRIVIGDNSAEVYSQEQLDEAKQEAYAAGVRDGADEQKEAYSELFMELATDDKAAADFVNGIVPADAAKELAAQNAEHPALKK